MTDRTLYGCDYVNQPYARVRDAVLANPDRVFRHATAAVASDAATLHVRLGGIDVGTDVAIEVIGVHHDQTYDRPATTLMLAWHAVHHARLFPSMMASFVMFALSPTETQLELRGSYVPPMGKLGEVLDAVAGHRLAEASATRFVQEVASWLRVELAPLIATPAAPPAGMAPRP